MVASKVELPLRGGGGVVLMSGQIETHSLGFRQWQTWLQVMGRGSLSGACSGRMVVQPAADFLAGSSNPGRVHMPAVPPIAADWQGFKPPTEKNAADCTTIRP